MDANQIRFAIFLGVFILMLVLEALLPRHPLVDSKPRRLGINLGLIGLNIIDVVEKDNYYERHDIIKSGNKELTKE